MAASGHGLQIGAVLGNKYRIERLLGAGAMGAVYRVVDEQGRTWAAKTLRHGGAELSDGPGSVARFVREGSEHSSLTSEHIVSVVDVGVDDRLHVPFFVMSLLSGFHLETLLERVGAIHPTVAVRMIVQACRGLIEAHSRGVVHRDIKPSNLFLHHGSDGRVTVKVCDFGIAKWSSAQDTLTSSGTFLGTPLYMSPEQATERVNAFETAIM